MRATQASFWGFRVSVESRQRRMRVRMTKSIAASDSEIATPDSRTMVNSSAIDEDWALVQQALGGDAHANEQIFSRHIPKLRRTARNILRNNEDAEDAVQDALFRAYTRLRSFRGKSALRTWLTRIVINSALMIRRKMNGRPEASLEDILDNQPQRLQQRMVDARPNPEEIYGSSEICGVVAEQIRQLPPRLREAVQLFDLDGLSTAGASQLLGIEKNAFKSRVSRARQKLANKLQQPLHRPTTALSQDDVIELPARRLRRRDVGRGGKSSAWRRAAWSLAHCLTRGTGPEATPG